MNDGTVLWLGLTAREVDLEARRLWGAWEDAGFDPLITSPLDMLVAIRKEARAYMPRYVLEGMKERGA